MNSPEVEAAEAVVRASGHTPDLFWVCLAVVGALILFVCLRRRNPVAEPSTEEEDVGHALMFLERPRRVYGGRWVRYKCSLVECDGPVEKRPIRIGNEPQREAARR